MKLYGESQTTYSYEHLYNLRDFVNSDKLLKNDKETRLKFNKAFENQLMGNDEVALNYYNDILMKYPNNNVVANNMEELHVNNNFK